MTLYEGLKFVHVLLAIVALGSNITYALWLRRAAAAPDHASQLLAGVKALDDRLANPAYALLLITGLGMVFEADIPFSTFWIWASLVLYGLVLIGGVALFTPVLRRQVAMAGAGRAGSSEYGQIATRGGIVGAAVNVLVVVIVFLMVTKPTL